MNEKSKNNITIDIPSYAAAVISRLEENGYKAYIVGGCVRDSLLGKTPHDFDVCTDCLPQKMQEIFSDHHTIETGLKHGTLTVMSEGEPVEVTTFRSDGEYSDHRRPVSVKFERELSEDLKRRDFTVNAMCYNQREGLTDLFGGREDLENKIIRCVGDAEKRFEEDALRIIRGLRFASVLGFDIDSKTAEAMRKKAFLLEMISAERIFVELKKLICGVNATEILLEYKDLIAVIIPEFIPDFGCEQHCPHHIYDVYGHICHSVSNIEPDEELRLVMLLHDIAKPQMKRTDENGTDHFKKHQFASAYAARDILTRLKSSTATKKRVFDLIWEHDNRIPAERRPVRRMLSKYSYEFFCDWLKVRRADTLAQSDYMRKEKLAELDRLKEVADEIMAENCCLKIKDLAISGKDLIEEGYSGKAVGEALDLALSGVTEEIIPNEKKEILDYIKENTK